MNQQWPWNPETPGGAWDFHKTLIPNSPAKPLRLWLQISDRDNFSDSDGMHDWVLANQQMAKVLADKGYPYQFLFTQGRRRTATAPSSCRRCRRRSSGSGRTTSRRRASQPA